MRADGRIRIPILRLNQTRDERENHLRTRRHLAERLVKERRPEEEVTDTHRDVAASLQACLDRTMEHLCGHFARKLGLRRLAMAGGVALNCTANGKLLRSGIFDDIYIQPAAGDDGTALGAALYRAAQAGEPWLSFFEPPQMQAKLRATGFTSVELLTPPVAESRYFQAPASLPTCAACRR